MTYRVAISTIALLLAATAAHGHTLYTASLVVGPEETGTCVVTNIGAQPAQVAIRLLNKGGVEWPAVKDTCAQYGTLQPRQTCYAVAGEAMDVTCVIESSSRKVLGALQVQDTSTTPARTVAAIPAAAK
jgi:hypothetical protein